MAPPKVIYEFKDTDGMCPLPSSGVMDAGNTYAAFAPACCLHDLNVTELTWEPEFGDYGRMKIVLGTACCNDVDSFYRCGCGGACHGGTGCDIAYFWLSHDGVTKGTQSIQVIDGRGTYYIVAAHSDCPYQPRPAGMAVGTTLIF